MCGIVGVIGKGDVFGELYDGLVAVQHRGQDAAGVATFDGQFHLKKDAGLVQDVFSEEDVSHLKGSMGIAHVRYPTVGGGGVEDAQPFLITSPFGIAIAHNGNVTNYHDLKRKLVKEQYCHINSGCDVEVILHVFAEELRKREHRLVMPDDVFAAAAEVFKQVKGSYSVVGMIAGQGMFAFRDPFGIKPLVMGEKEIGGGEKSYCFTSENVALDLLEYTTHRDLKAGEVVFIDMERKVRARQVAPANHHPCIFEWVYFARPDATIDEINVYKSRLRLGEALADEWLKTGLKADVVIPVPDSARPAAMAMARKLNLPYREGLVKHRYIGRTFIMPKQSVRQRSIRYKLNPIPLEFEGKDVLIVDDSIVRGNTSKAIVKLARQAGAKKVYLASYSPPINYPCVYGIDMSTRSEFIARDKTPQEVAKLIGADHLIYQSMEGLEKSVREGNPAMKNFCTACFSGDYPTKDVTPEILAEWEKDRGESPTPNPPASVSRL